MEEVLMWKPCVFLSAILFTPAAGFAATLDVTGLVSVVDNGLSGVRQESSETRLSREIDGFARGQDAAALGRGEGTSNYFVDSRTGVFRLGSFASLDRGLSDASRAGGNIKVTLTESFVARGSGTATFQFDYDGAFFNAGTENSRRGYNAGSRADVELTADIRDGNRIVTKQDRSGASQTFIGDRGTFNSTREILTYQQNNSFAELRELSFDLVDGQTFEFGISFFVGSTAGSNEGRTNADFTNTGYLDFRTSSGLNLVASNNNFLADATGRPSGPGTPAPIPLPAGGWLMLAGLASLTWLRRQTSMTR
ncbi:VPLPA-CTERM sorting domain-containing protein [Roseobacter cerasinus]|nr:VPLPA-CTERM sorting domain-containing protein [Roseobacter cerasinus]